MTLEQRVRNLEWQHRWTRRIVGIMLVAVGVVVLVEVRKEDKLPDLDVRSLTVKDESGTPRLMLLVRPDGASALGLADAKGRVRFGVVLAAGSPVINLVDENETARLWLELLPNGSPSLELRDKDGNNRAVLGVREDKEPATGARIKTDEGTLTLFDAKGNVIWQAPR